jgi:tetratricopeptide (TPR) repeat protein
MSQNLTTQTVAEALATAKEHIAQRAFPGALEALVQFSRQQIEDATSEEKEEFYYYLGVAYNGIERPSEAISQLSRSLQIAEKNQDAGGQARCLEELGSAHHQRSDYRQALFLYAKALETYQKLENKAGLARGLRNLAGAKVDIGQNAEALEDYKAARQLFGELGDSEGVATCVTNSALLVFRYQGRQATIQEYKNELAKGDCSHFLVYNNIGFLQLLEGTYAEARENLEKGALDCQERKVGDDNLGLLHLNLGIIATIEKQYDKADEHYKQATEIFTAYPAGRAVEVCLIPSEAAEKHQLPAFFSTDDAQKIAITLLNTAVNAWERGQKELALELCEKAAGMDKDQAYPFALLGWLQRLSDKETEAVASFKKASSREPRNELFKRFLDLLNPYANAKAGRNDPCPCGSGKKFKKCHGAA